MKVLTKTLPALLLLFLAEIMLAQQPVCSPAQSGIDLDANQLSTRIWTNGKLFFDAQFLYNPNPNVPKNPSTIYSASLWMAGIDAGGNLRLNCPDYGSGSAAGPLNTDGLTSPDNCANWDRLFLVKGSEIAAFLADLPNLAANPATALAQYKGIMGWPGKGNPYFQDIWGYTLPFSSQNLAPFLDQDGDGNYDPLKGDYPVVALQGKGFFVPALMAWCVFNSSNTGTFNPTETQLTAWQFDCPDQPVLHRTLFTSHKVIYRGTEPLDSCFAGIWVDFDLGCYTDDYIGSNPGLHSFFAYNQDAVDGSTGAFCDGGVTTFADNPPVQSVTMLNRSLDKLIYYNTAGVGSQPSSTTDPDLPIEYYNYMNGRWRDGTPLTQGGSGFNPASSIPADYAFPASPSDPAGWSMCTANLSFGDRKALGINKLGTIFPGAVMEFTTAWTTHPDIDLPCGVGNTFSEVELVRAAFDAGFSTACLPLSDVVTLPESVLDIFPNPSAGALTVAFGELPVREIRVFSPDGKLTEIVRNIPTERAEIILAAPASGVYTVQVLTEQGVVAKKVAVVK